MSPTDKPYLDVALARLVDSGQLIEEAEEYVSGNNRSASKTVFRRV